MYAWASASGTFTVNTGAALARHAGIAKKYLSAHISRRQLKIARRPHLRGIAESTAPARSWPR
jgi:hypothetical protein